MAVDWFIKLPKKSIEIFSSGTQAFRNTIAGPFDIQPRAFILAPSSELDPIDSIHPIFHSDYYQSIMFKNQVEAIEGLITDTRMGRAAIGFRNHTLPKSPFGGRWYEVFATTSCGLINSGTALH